MFWTAAIGAVVGAAAVMLSDKQQRVKLKNKLDSLMSNVEETKQKGKDKLTSELKKAKSKLKDQL